MLARLDKDYINEGVAQEYILNLLNPRNMPMAKQLDKNRIKVTLLEKWGNTTPFTEDSLQSKQHTHTYDWWKAQFDSGTTLAEIVTDPKNSLYVSGATYAKFGRIQSNINCIHELYLDIDLDHTANKPIPIKEATKFVSQLFVHLCDTKKLPLPSLTVYTGRGVHLHWFIKPITQGKLAYWLKVQTQIYQEVLNYYMVNNLDISQLDALKDAGRVLRIPGTHNHKAGIQASILPTCSNHEVYDMDELCRIYWPQYYRSAEDIERLKEKRLLKFEQKKKIEVSAVKKQYNGSYTQNMNRIKDMYILQELRGHDFKCREMAIYFVRMCAIFATKGDKIEAERIAWDFNSNFAEPLPKKRFDAETVSAEQRWYTSDGIKRKPWTNDTIITKLGITSSELACLKTIRLGKQTPAESNEKRRNSRRNAEGLTPRQQKEKELTIAVHKLKQEGYSIPDIVTKLGISKSSVYNKLKVELKGDQV